jgi:hypothetical protein
MVLPPDTTMLANKSARISTSQFMMALKAVSAIFSDSTYTYQGWLEENLGTTETFVIKNNDVTAGKLVGLLKGRRRFCGPLHLLIEVKSDVAKRFLDTIGNLTFGGAVVNEKPEPRSVRIFIN